MIYAQRDQLSNFWKPKDKLFSRYLFKQNLNRLKSDELLSIDWHPGSI